MPQVEVYRLVKEMHERRGGVITVQDLQHEFERPRGPGDHFAVRAQYVRKHLEVRTWIEDGREFHVAYDETAKRAYTFMFEEERRELEGRISELIRENAKECQKFTTLRSDLRTWERMPWWKRVWCAYRKILP